MYEAEGTLKQKQYMNQGLTSAYGAQAGSISPAREPGLTAIAQQFMERANSLHDCASGIESMQSRILTERSNKASEPGYPPETPPTTIEDTLRVALRSLANLEGRLRTVISRFEEGI